jgi:predicted Zn-dependent protease
MASYPGYMGQAGLGLVYFKEGEYEKGAQAFRECNKELPDSPGVCMNLANATLALQRSDEARQIIAQEQARKVDNYILHMALYGVDFPRGDAGAMAEQQQWFAGRPEESQGLSLASDTEAYTGHVGKARELTKWSVESAVRADRKENGAIWLENVALREAAFGNLTQAKQTADEGRKLGF